MLNEEDTFTSITWDDHQPTTTISNQPASPHTTMTSTISNHSLSENPKNHYQHLPIQSIFNPSSSGLPSSPPSPSTNKLNFDHSINPSNSYDHQQSNDTHSPSNRSPSLIVHVKHPVRELQGTKDSFVSYLVTAQTDLPIFHSTNPSARRRFQDFVFLHDHLVKDFPASVVPPLPDKSRLKYVTGDRFSPDFVERRRSGLERFMQRLARHPTLSRSKLLRSFIESTQWNVDMHTHLAHPPIPESPSSLLEMASDTLLNAFSKVRKPDERFLEIRDGLDRFEERLVAIERIQGRSRNRMTDLANDYEDFAASIQGLGFLESGITDPLSRFESALLDYSIGLRDLNSTTTTPLLIKLVSLINYSDSFRNVLKLRDQKQLDFEELSSYLSNLTTDRDRIAAGFSTNPGLSSYLKEKLELIRNGPESDTSREAKIYKLDGKIKDLQEAVTSAHETSDQFNQEVLKEFKVFQDSKAVELKEILSDLADGNIAMYKKSIQDWENMIPFFERIRVDN